MPRVVNSGRTAVPATEATVPSAFRATIRVAPFGFVTVCVSPSGLYAVRLAFPSASVVAATRPSAS